MYVDISYSGALAREARAVEYHGYENLVIYPCVNIWSVHSLGVRERNLKCQPVGGGVCYS